MTQFNLLGLTLEELYELAARFGQKPYRARQIFAWLYQQGASSIEEMTDLGRQFRRDMGAGGYYVGALKIMSEQVSQVDGTRKFLFGLEDGQSIESVLIPEEDRQTVCFSSQAGCAMGCMFCATGRGGWVRNLSAGEMVGQVLHITKRTGVRITNAVAMGQGEPFANYDQCMRALRLLNDPEGPAIGARRLTVSTCGLVPEMRRFAGEPEQFGLAVSLHAARDELRSKLMPIGNRFPLAELRRACMEYVESTHRRVTLEYALIAGVNDSDGDLTALIAFCRGWQSHVNVIPLNEVEGIALRRSAPDRIRQFFLGLENAGIAASIRKEKGADLDAACGQLRQRQVLNHTTARYD